MGFEVVYRYHEKLEEGGYDKSETKEMKRKVGEPFEDVPLETLAQKIMAQMARRDIWVLPDVEIYELKKQKVNFRETKGGVIIKNKKFLLDTENNSIISQEIPEEGQQNLPVVHQSTQLVPAGGPLPHNQLAVTNGQQQRLRPIKFVVMDEGVIQDVKGDRVPVPVAVKRAGLQFRPGQRYPVFKEMDDPRDKRVDKYGAPALDRKKVYVMWDDHKREVMVSQDYFVPADVQYQQDSRLDPFSAVPSGGSAPKLMFEGEEEGAAMPDLRSR
jgi:hypothetical protein